MVLISIRELLCVPKRPFLELSALYFVLCLLLEPTVATPTVSRRTKYKVPSTKFAKLQFYSLNDLFDSPETLVYPSSNATATAPDQTELQ